MGFTRDCKCDILSTKNGCGDIYLHIFLVGKPCMLVLYQEEKRRSFGCYKSLFNPNYAAEIFCDQSIG